MIVDVKCMNPECGKVQVDLLVKNEAAFPKCSCGTDTERLWSMTRPGSHRSGNEASISFRLNYPKS